MVNKIFKEYTEELNNIDSNYEKIILKSQKNKKVQTIKRRLLNIASIFVVVVVFGTISTKLYAKIKWDIKFKEYQNRDYTVSEGIISDAVGEGYLEKIDMEYVEQDGIKAKVDSLMITDDKLNAEVSFEFADNINLNSETFSFGYAIYDSENNIYGINNRMHIGANGNEGDYTKYIYKELGVKYDKNDIFAIQLSDAGGVQNISANNRNIVSKITMDSTKGFPKSNKLYIRVFDLGYGMIDLEKKDNTSVINAVEDFTISNAEWIFEINVPSKFYNRETFELKLKDNIPGLEIEKIQVTELGLVMKAKMDGFDEFVLQGKDMNSEEWNKLQNDTINITDSDGNIYYSNSGSYSGKDFVKANYEINKNIFNKGIFLNIKINGKQYSSEIVRK